jgi:hypothetical protein
MAARVSPPPASENALLSAMACPHRTGRIRRPPRGRSRGWYPPFAVLPRNASQSADRCRGSAHPDAPRWRRAPRLSRSPRIRSPRPHRWAAEWRRHAPWPARGAYGPCRACSPRTATCPLPHRWRPGRYWRCRRRRSGDPPWPAATPAPSAWWKPWSQRRSRPAAGWGSRARARGLRAHPPAAGRRRPPARTARRRGCSPRPGARYRRRPSRIRRRAQPSGAPGLPGPASRPG